MMNNIENIYTKRVIYTNNLFYFIIINLVFYINDYFVISNLFSYNRVIKKKFFKKFFSQI